jgi:tagatose-1,6-bisphosphate aldolase non-catalytic subunit AgaZ/GatZ
MDLFKVIDELREERKRLDYTIKALENIMEGEEIASWVKPSKRRGRKSMSREERQRVSDRMRRYWAARRKKAAQETVS